MCSTAPTYWFQWLLVIKKILLFLCSLENEPPQKHLLPACGDLNNCYIQVYVRECSRRRHLRGCLWMWRGFQFYLWPTSLSKDFGSCQWFRKPKNFYVSKVVFLGCRLFHILKLVSAFRRTLKNSSGHWHAFTLPRQKGTDRFQLCLWVDLDWVLFWFPSVALTGLIWEMK